MMNHDERLAEIEKQISALHEERTQLLKESAKMNVDNYELKNSDGSSISLKELFGDKRDLIVVHNMGKSCSYCTLWADGFNGLSLPLADRAAFVVASPDTPEVQTEFAGSRGWKFKMVSTSGSTFGKDMGFTMQHEGKWYEMPGYSTFRLNDDGSINRVGKDFFGPGDVYCGVWQMFTMLDEGVNNWHPKYTYA